MFTAEGHKGKNVSTRAMRVRSSRAPEEGVQTPPGSQLSHNYKIMLGKDSGSELLFILSLKKRSHIIPKLLVSHLVPYVFLCCNQIPLVFVFCKSLVMFPASSGGWLQYVK